jgi:hypothetical protein
MIAHFGDTCRLQHGFTIGAVGYSADEKSPLLAIPGITLSFSLWFVKNN